MLVMLFIFPAGLARANWPEQTKLTASEGAALDQFGISVSISGDTAVIGAKAFSDKINKIKGD